MYPADMPDTTASDSQPLICPRCGTPLTVPCIPHLTTALASGGDHPDQMVDYLEAPMTRAQFEAWRDGARAFLDSWEATHGAIRPSEAVSAWATSVRAAVARIAVGVQHVDDSQE